MFGYVAPAWDGLSEAERERYREAYCGLCRAIGERCGQRCRCALTHDLVFLSLLLGSLYEPREHAGAGRCAPHPMKPHRFVRTECVDYAADATVALAYHKALDDWRDDRSVRARAFARALAGPYRAVRARNPRMCGAIEAGVADIAAIEEAARGVAVRAQGATDEAKRMEGAAAAQGASRAGRVVRAGGAANDEGGAHARDAAPCAGAAPAPDAAANRFGVLMGELFAYRPDDFWSDDLRRLGARLGKFVYVMDAAMDYEDDRVSGSYNPLVAIGADAEDVREDLTLLMAGVAEAFERLPLERDLRLLRSVVYAGVWRKYNARENDKEKRRG
ncbi:DUF5685 family protein [Gordonibacter sp. An230]|uniref:DUF5685 family protein n=1 Tax=Gordonibacter sp. An230 TaxID=1965592 RepID=UPI001EF5506C|nr:DUF5685 family protein [Gordonibacter sp. An230]